MCRVFIHLEIPMAHQQIFQHRSVYKSLFTIFISQYKKVWGCGKNIICTSKPGVRSSIQSSVKANLCPSERCVVSMRSRGNDDDGDGDDDEMMVAKS